jgi:4-hydroxy-4-methyl-2-oxoglutarate aldolase
VLVDAGARLAKEAAETLDEWEAVHRARVEKLLAERGFAD